MGIPRFFMLGRQFNCRPNFIVQLPPQRNGHSSRLKDSKPTILAEKQRIAMPGQGFFGIN
jgi:hypothetical protein